MSDKEENTVVLEKKTRKKPTLTTEQIEKRNKILADGRAKAHALRRQMEQERKGTSKVELKVNDEPDVETVVVRSKAKKETKKKKKIVYVDEESSSSSSEEEVVVRRKKEKSKKKARSPSPKPPPPPPPAPVPAPAPAPRPAQPSPQEIERRRQEQIKKMRQDEKQQAYMKSLFG